MTRVFFAGVNPTHYPQEWDWEARPLNVLVSFAYLKHWHKSMGECPWMRVSRTMIDSGAFTAYTKGEVVDIDALTEEVNTGGKFLRPGGWDEAVGLDVIGDWEGSRRNADYMREKGAVRAMPVFHIGDPMELLDYYCKHWPKVGLSCLFGEARKDSFRFYEQCFARAWPHRFHSFGWAAENVLMTFPFDSADSSTWLASRRYMQFTWRGRGKTITHQYHLDGGRHTRVHGIVQALEHSYRMQQRLEDKWLRYLSPLRKDEHGSQDQQGARPEVEPPRQADQRADDPA